VGILLFHLIKSIAMRNIHHLLAVLSIIIISGATLAMIKGQTMTELVMALVAMVTGGVLFLIYTYIDNELKSNK
jgi:hypothetical protein